MKTKSLFFGMFFAAFAAVGASAQSRVEIPQEQGGNQSEYTAASVSKKAGYTEYTVSGEEIVRVAFKMVDVDVKGCDKIEIDFAEKLDAEWEVSFYAGRDYTNATKPDNEKNPGTVSLSADGLKLTYELPADVKTSGVLPQICLLTVFKKSTFVAKVKGVYKVKSTSTPVEDLDAADATVVGIYDLTGKKYDELQKGVNIVKMSNGDVKKVVK